MRPMAIHPSRLRKRPKWDLRSSRMPRTARLAVDAAEDAEEGGRDSRRVRLLPRRFRPKRPRQLQLLKA